MINISIVVWAGRNSCNKLLGLFAPKCEHDLHGLLVICIPDKEWGLCCRNPDSVSYLKNSGSIHCWQTPRLAGRKTMHAMNLLQVSSAPHHWELVAAIGVWHALSLWSLLVYVPKSCIYMRRRMLDPASSRKVQLISTFHRPMLALKPCAAEKSVSFQAHVSGTSGTEGGL